MADPVNAEPYGREGLPLEQARAQILEALQPLGFEETLPLTEALGRTTAASVLAAAEVPGFRASIMDGYAIAGGAQPEPGQQWRLVGASSAGAPYGQALAAGEAVRILTGAVVPEGSERVLPQELVALEGEQLAQSLDRRVDRVHLDDVVKLQWQRHAHARTHAAVHARTHACTPRNS